MKKNLFAIIALWLVVSSCEYNNFKIKCYRGRIIMSSCCTGSTFIDIDPAYPIGKATALNGKNYQNVIQVPGYLNEGNEAEIYLDLRAFDGEKDRSLFPPIQCYCFIAVGEDVPVWVDIAYSFTSCPKSGD